MHTTPIGRIVRAATATVSAALTLLFVLAPAAHAHDTLISSTPWQDEQLSAPPQEIVLTFSAKLLDLNGEGFDLLLGGPCTDQPDGCFPQNLSDGTAQKAVLDGEKLRRKVNALPQGQYEVRWRVISSDGHPISGAYHFAIGEPVSTPTPRSHGSEPREQTTEDSVSLGWLPWPALGAGVALLAYLGYVLITNRQRRPPEDSP